MTTWSSDELAKICAAEELQIVPLRTDGTLRNSGSSGWAMTSTSGRYTGAVPPGSAAYRCVPRVTSGPEALTRSLSLWKSRCLLSTIRSIPPLCRKHRQHHSEFGCAICDDQTYTALDKHLIYRYYFESY